MKKILLPDTNVYKANLHCHTDYSDGRLSPEQVKEEYIKNGYSVVAYTDHDIFVTHNNLTDDKFLALNGYEVEITENGGAFEFLKCCHLCFIALDKNKTEQVCLNRKRYMFANAPKHFSEMNFGNADDYDREYTPECINDMISKARNAGFFVSYNHPTWSLENYEQYSKYEGMNALEIYNGSCITAGYIDENTHCYDDMLRLGKRIACTGSDDNHNVHPIGSPYCDSFAAFTMIHAENLEYNTVTKALEDGNYYASEGPVIKGLTFEDGKINVKTSDADRIIFITGVRRTGIVRSEPSETISEGSFSVKSTDKYVRVIVIDKSGNKAETRAYFTDELF